MTPQQAIRNLGRLREDEPMYYIAFNGDDFQGFFEQVCGDEIDDPWFLYNIFEIVNNDYKLESIICGAMNTAIMEAIVRVQEEYNNNHKGDSE